MRRILLAIALVFFSSVPLYAGEKMPSLSDYTLLQPENTAVRSEGRIIKWLDYGNGNDRTILFRTISMACDHVTQTPPFLIHDFKKNLLFVDLDGDGVSEETIDLSVNDFDPVDYFKRLPVGRKCDGLIAEAAPLGAATLFQILFLF